MAGEAGVDAGDAPLRRWEALLAAAREVLAERGLEAATVAEIVARAGVAQGTFYLYFPSMQAVVFALTEEMNTAVLVAVGRAFTLAGSLGEGIDRAVAEAFRIMASYRDVLGIVRSRAGGAGMSAEWRALDEPFEEVMAGLIRGAQATGQAPAFVNAAVCTRLMRGLIEHALRLLRGGRGGAGGGIHRGGGAGYSGGAGGSAGAVTDGQSVAYHGRGAPAREGRPAERAGD